MAAHQLHCTSSHAHRTAIHGEAVARGSTPVRWALSRRKRRATVPVRLHSTFLRVCVHVRWSLRPCPCVDIYASFLTLGTRHSEGMGLTNMSFGLNLGMPCYLRYIYIARAHALPFPTFEIIYLIPFQPFSKLVPCEIGARNSVHFTCPCMPEDVDVLGFQSLIPRQLSYFDIYLVFKKLFHSLFPFLADVCACIKLFPRQISYFDIY